jgi:DnaJ-domain-containing protein 1
VGIIERLKRIVKANISDYTDGRTFDDILNESDEELKRIISELNNSKNNSDSRNSSSRQQSHATPRHSAQQNVVAKAYSVLNLRQTASIDEIKSAYRKLIRQYHPDVVANQSKENQESAKRHAQELNLAYEILQKVRGFS